MKTLAIKTLLVCAMLNASAQNTRPVASLDEVARPVATKGWIDFRPENELNPYTLFTENKQLFGLTPLDEMRQYKIQTDEIGFTHIRFQQYYNGLKVEGAEVILHHNGQYLKSMNGKIAEQLNITIVPTIATELALTNAKSVCKAEKFVWEHADIANALSKSTSRPKEFNKPVGELIICRNDWNGNFEKENMVLAYKYQIIVLPMSESHDVYVNAITGNVIHKNPISTNCNTNTGITTWYGAKAFNAGWYGFPNNAWLLESHCPGEAIMRSMRGDPLIPYSYGDADGSWTDADGVSGYNQRSGVTAYWNIHKAYDYYKYNHNRLSYDGANAQLDVFSEVAGGLWVSAENAAWNTVWHVSSFGAGATSSATDDWNTTDIVGHELTHGMHQWSVGWNYSYEPGALDESFADIFGECIEAYSSGAALPNWLVGTDRGKSLRSFSNPNALMPAIGGGFWGAQPDTYMGTNWQPSSDPSDNGGVHQNSGVQNFWFYLLTMGGSGSNDYGHAYNVTGIGLAPAASIAYRNMDTYMTTASIYIDSREGSIRAAEDLYGNCSNNVLQVARAWYAVGVTTFSPDYNYIVPCGNIANNASLRGVNSLVTSVCPTNVLSGNYVVFYSSTTGGVTLKPGFTAQQGSNFTAHVTTCSEAAYNVRTAANDENNSNSKNDLSEENGLNVTSIYPNPAKDVLAIELMSNPNEGNCTVTITDLTGRKIEVPLLANREYNNVRQIKLDIATLKDGIYFAVIKNNTQIKSAKFVVRK